MRIGEVSKLLGMPVETIRFYERQGVIAPERMGDGKYREYTEWDVFYLVDCAIYRKLGLTVKETVNALHLENVDYFIECIKRSRRDLEKNIEQEVMLLTHLKEMERKLDALTYNIDRYWVEKCPALSYIVNFERIDKEYRLVQENQKLFSTWYEKMPFIASTQMVSLDILDGDGAPNRDCWCAVVETEMMEALGLSVTDDVHSLPESYCLKTIWDAGKRGEMDLEHYRRLLTKVRSEGYEPDGPIHANLLVRCGNKKELHRYFEVMIPICKVK